MAAHARRGRSGEVSDTEALFLAALRRRNPRHIARMEALGVPARIEGRPPLWGAYPAIIEEDRGLWLPTDPQPGERTRDLVVVPAGWADLDGVFFDSIDDLAGFFLDDPERWFLLRGDASVLGPDNAWDAGFYRRPLDIYSTPLDWLRAGGAGCCIVDWRLVPANHLGDAPVLRCDAPALRDKLLTRHRQCQTPWQVTIAKPSQVAA